MNTDSSRPLRLIPATRSDTPVAPVSGRIEVRSLAGHMIDAQASTQPDVSSDVTPTAPIRMLRLAQVASMTGLSKAKVYALQSRGDFPHRVQLTAGRVAWVEAEVQAWLAARIAANTPLTRR